MGKATQDLRNEHDAILFVLQILDKMLQSKEKSREAMLQYYGELVYFLQIFADKCHHGKEELYLFQEMVRLGFDYYRYVDDIRIICDSPRAARHAATLLIGQLRTVGMNAPFAPSS